MVFFCGTDRMCDSSDPAKAAELYITASEMNVVRNSCCFYHWKSKLTLKIHEDKE